jgi:hypothetical protein
MAAPLEMGGLNDAPHEQEHPTITTGSGLFITESEFVHDN